jgi:hypothetical protein
LSVYSQAHLNKVARQLNERPRKTLGFETPAEKFNAALRRPVEPAVKSRHSGNGHRKSALPLATSFSSTRFQTRSRAGPMLSKLVAMRP